MADEKNKPEEGKPTGGAAGTPSPGRGPAGADPRNPAPTTAFSGPGAEGPQPSVLGGPPVGGQGPVAAEMAEGPARADYDHSPHARNLETQRHIDARSGMIGRNRLPQHIASREEFKSLVLEPIASDAQRFTLASNAIDQIYSGLDELAKVGMQYELIEASERPKALHEWPKMLYNSQWAPEGRVFNAPGDVPVEPGWFDHPTERQDHRDHRHLDRKGQLATSADQRYSTDDFETALREVRLNKGLNAGIEQKSDSDPKVIERVQEHLRNKYNRGAGQADGAARAAGAGNAQTTSLGREVNKSGDANESVRNIHETANPSLQAPKQTPGSALSDKEVLDKRIEQGQGASKATTTVVKPAGKTIDATTGKESKDKD